jgi:hypothetical protein
MFRLHCDFKSKYLNYRIQWRSLKGNGSGRSIRPVAFPAALPKIIVMKKILIFLASFLSLLLLVLLSCDKSEMQEQAGNKPASNENTEVTTPTNDWVDTSVESRVDTCADCPAGDCCCALVIVSGGSANISLCGTTDGTGTCSGGTPPNCPTITNGGQSFTLDVVINPLELFCMDQNTALAIRNTSGNSVQLALTCQMGQPSTQVDTFTVASNSTVFYETDGNCEVSECQ